MNKKERLKSTESESNNSSHSERETKILAFWEKENIFQKTLEKPSPNGNFVFYDGPPFATGLPHYGHVLPGTIKDIIPRFETMRGKFVRRVWGWDCHGLPVENLIEKELGLKSKKDIEEYGVEKFNRAARESVLRYDKDWKEIVPRLGRWIDMEKAYLTMDTNYTESGWWAFKELYNKGLVYKSFKSMHICPRCETTLSNFEINQGYKDIQDISLTAKFRLTDPQKVVETDKVVSFLAWTTTPWTLPGNVALAVGSDISYSVLESEGECFILATECLEKAMKEKEYKKIKELKGQDLVGLSYTPIFDYYFDKVENKENGWQVYSADFVNTEDGTGIVHIAPAFGSDDFDLQVKHELPFVQHVGFNGKFNDEVSDFKGLFVKLKENHQVADIEVIKNLAGRELLFSKEKISHSYPHCWRCDTPLLNYATDSWFIAVTKFRDTLIEENKKVSWVPEHVGRNRFGKWLEEARDWSISRSRFWGSPIPVWQCDSCDDVQVIGSVKEIRQKSNNQYEVMRHGQAENNVSMILNSDPEFEHHLTETGIEQVKKTAKEYKQKKPDIIISSDFVRTRETAELFASEIGLPKESILFDKRLREMDFGELHLQSVEKYRNYFPNWQDRFENPLPKGESFNDIKIRMGDLLDDLEEKYKDKKILLVSHETPIWLLYSVGESADKNRCIDIRGDKEDFVKNAEICELPFYKYPHNEKRELDLHRPYIDQVKLPCKCGGEMKRIPEVFDTWYDSGSMPFAQAHYPFENKAEFEKEKSPLFPANFIAEGQDQTRGWFYTLLTLSSVLFGCSPFKTVVVNGTILAEDGRKMSKRLKNYPEIMDVVNRHGADALRYTLMSMPAVKAEDVAFSESMVEESVKKVIGRALNVLSFFEMYQGQDVESSRESDNVLDRWIISEVDRLGQGVTENIEGYQIDKATRLFGDFVDNISTWYLRRSRDRIKSQGKDREQSLGTLRYALNRFALLSAPFIPFLAEHIYLKVRKDNDPQSVHLESWPTEFNQELGLLKDMVEVRTAVSLGLEQRSRNRIKVRQPLKSASFKNLSESIVKDSDMLELIRDELNVKEIIVKKDLLEEVELDTNITEDLKQEGYVREIVRKLQDSRKNAGLQPTQKVILSVESSDEAKLIMSRAEEILKERVAVSEIKFIDELLESEELNLENLNLKLQIDVL